MTHKPMIAVMPLYDSEKRSYWMLPGYLKGIEKAGGIPVVLPLTTDPDEIGQLSQSFDGFLLTGGQDVSPRLYGQKLSPFCGEVCFERDEMERLILGDAIRMGKPVLGICRGIQILNVVLGGSLYQDIPTEYPSVLEHHQKPPYDLPVHQVSIVPDSPLFSLLGRRSLAVNSYHHQAIKRLSNRLVAMAYAEDGLVEAAYMPSARFVLAVQWHPEFSYEKEESSLAILRKFVRKAAENR